MVCQTLLVQVNQKINISSLFWFESICLYNGSVTTSGDVNKFSPPFKYSRNTPGVIEMSKYIQTGVTSHICSVHRGNGQFGINDTSDQCSEVLPPVLPPCGHHAATLRPPCWYLKNFKNYFMGHFIYLVLLVGAFHTVVDISDWAPSAERPTQARAAANCLLIND